MYSALIFLRKLLWQSAFTVPHIACSDTACWLNLSPKPSHQPQFAGPVTSSKVMSSLCLFLGQPTWQTEHLTIPVPPLTVPKGFQCFGVLVQRQILIATVPCTCDWVLPASVSPFLREVFKALFHPVEWERGKNGATCSVVRTWLFQEGTESQIQMCGHMCFWGYWMS